MASKSDEFSVANIFPADKLAQFNTSDLVKSLNPTDFEDMTKAFSVPPVRTENPKILKLTTHDLVSIEALFGDYRASIIANYHAGPPLPHLQKLAAKGSSCCCCCTPCCSCCSAATQVEPLSN